MTGSTCIIFYALSTVTSGVLQSIDRMNLPVIHSLISLAIHVVVVFTLLRFTGMGAYALVFGNVTYPLVVCFLNGRSVSRNLWFQTGSSKNILCPVFVFGGNGNTDVRCIRVVFHCQPSYLCCNRTCIGCGGCKLLCFGIEVAGTFQVRAL